MMEQAVNHMPGNRLPKGLEVSSLLLMVLLLLTVVGLSAGMGYIKIGWLDVLRAIGVTMGGDMLPATDLEELTRVVVMEVRLTRILTAALVGGGLSLCVVVFQGILLNPLADPHTLGVSAGAAYGRIISLYGAHTVNLVALDAAKRNSGGVVSTHDGFPTGTYWAHLREANLRHVP